MNERVFTELLDQFKLGRLDAENAALLDQYLQDPAYAHILDTYLRTALDEEAQVALVADAAIRTRLEARLDEMLAAEKVIQTPVRSMRRWWAAAAVLLLIGAGTGIWLMNKKSDHPTETVYTNNIQPGKEGAILTLADGSRISLDTVKNASIPLPGGVTAKVVNGALRYEGTGLGTVYNTMSTPNGRQFRLTLPDGTEVWLNSTSSIHFPTAFTNGERKVNITGEVYFEVAHDAARPFRVTVNDQTEITVLGTQFNVNAYDNEGKIATTLLEGSVQVSNRTAAVTLKRGQQAQIATGATAIQVINHNNTDQVVAWKNGLFSFENASLAEIMRQLERWYDIDVVYETTVPDIALKGEITRDVPLNDLLTALSKMGVQYKLERRRLTIKQ